MVESIIWLIIVVVILSIGLGFLKQSGIPMEANTADLSNKLIKILCVVVLIVVVVMLVAWLLSLAGLTIPRPHLP